MGGLIHGIHLRQLGYLWIYIDNSFVASCFPGYFRRIFTCQGLAAMQGETVARWMLMTSSLKSRDGILALKQISGNKCQTGNEVRVFFHFSAVEKSSCCFRLAVTEGTLASCVSGAESLETKEKRRRFSGQVWSGGHEICHQVREDFGLEQGPIGECVMTLAFEG